MPSRRHALQALASAGLLGLAGCSALDGADSGPDPDAGTASYGVAVRNDTNYRQRASVRVDRLPEQASTPTEVFAEAVTLRPGADRSWDRVLTDPVTHIVRVAINGGDAQHERAMRRISVGQDYSPSVADVTAVLHSITLRSDVRRTTAVRIEPDAEA